MADSFDAARRLWALQALALGLSACGGGGGGSSAPPAPAPTPPAPSPATPSAITMPLGTTASAGSNNSSVVSHAQVQGLLVRVGWDEIEPRAGAFDFAPIESKLTLLRTAGKKWSLSVLGGPTAPSWLYASPYNVSPLAITFRAVAAQVPKFWDATLQQRLAALAQALGAQYGSDPLLQLVYLPQMSANGVEGHFNGNSNGVLTGQGFTEDLWVGAVLQGIAAFAQAFASKPIGVELHDILGSANAGRRIMQAIEGDAALLRQVGVALWWLSGKTTYQSDLLTAFGSFRGSLFAQLIARASDATSFQGSDYSSAFTQARSLGIKYIEPWDVDFSSHLWDTLFSDFNAYAAT